MRWPGCQPPSAHIDCPLPGYANPAVHLRASHVTLGRSSHEGACCSVSTQCPDLHPSPCSDTNMRLAWPCDAPHKPCVAGPVSGQRRMTSLHADRAAREGTCCASGLLRQRVVSQRGHNTRLRDSGCMRGNPRSSPVSDCRGSWRVALPEPLSSNGCAHAGPIKGGVPSAETAHKAQDVHMRRPMSDLVEAVKG